MHASPCQRGRPSLKVLNSDQTLVFKKCHQACRACTWSLTCRSRDGRSEHSIRKISAAATLPKSPYAMNVLGIVQPDAVTAARRQTLTETVRKPGLSLLVADAVNSCDVVACCGMSTRGNVAAVFVVAAIYGWRPSFAMVPCLGNISPMELLIDSYMPLVVILLEHIPASRPARRKWASANSAPPPEAACTALYAPHCTHRNTVA